MSTFTSSSVGDIENQNCHNRKHALVIPLPTQQAHVAGMYRFALQLAKRGVTITFVSVPDDITKMKTYEELRGLDFNFIPIEITPPPSTIKASPIERLLMAMAANFKPILEDLKAKQNAGIPGPTCIVYDRYCNWANDVAEQLHLPLFSFFSCGAVYARYLQVLPVLLSSEGPLRCNDDGSVQEFEGLNVPGLPPPLTLADLPRSPWGGIKLQLDVQFGPVLNKSDAVIVNTFYELERAQIDAIEKHLAEHATASGRSAKAELVLVGPLSNAAIFKDRAFTRISINGVKSQLEAEEVVDSLQWLQSQPPRSVLFICMGTLFKWSPQQVQELALALEASKQRFLWVLPIGAQDALLLADFEERTRGMGFVETGWVPQLQILAHPAVRGFLSHCGWNSCIESVSSGVPLVCWPQFADQHLNRKHFVDVLKIGVDVGPRELGPTFVTREEFEKAFKLLMSEDEGNAIHSRVRDLMLKARAAVTDDGATSKAFDRLAGTIIPGTCTSVPSNS